MRNTTHTMRGFTLIEAALVLFIFSVVVMTFYETWTLGMAHILNAKHRLGATALANQKMEMMRSLPYGSIGTKRWNGTSWAYGVPAGDILQDEAVSSSGGEFMVHTDVAYVDDPYDGTLGGSPNDTAYTDYKRIRIEVSWAGGGNGNEVSVFATISQDGVEAASNTGVLSINVLNAAGDGVPQASVRVVNEAAGVDFTTDTDSTGNLMVLGLEAGSQNYELSVSKSGYYGGITYDPSPPSVFLPIDVHASVAVGAVNQKSIIVDELASITIETVDPFGASIPDVNFQISGGRQIGISADAEAKPVYDFSDTSTTGSTGSKGYQNRSYGHYSFILDEPGYEIFHTSTEVGPNNEGIDVLPGESKVAKIVLLDTSASSLLVTVTENGATTPVSGASVRLSNTALSYDVTRTTNANGQVFFPETLPVLQAGDYDIAVSATGYQSNSGTVSLDGSGLRKESVSLILE